MIKLVDILNEIALNKVDNTKLSDKQKKLLIQQAKDLLIPKEDPEDINYLFKDTADINKYDTADINKYFEEVAAMLSDRINKYGSEFKQESKDLLKQMGYPDGYEKRIQHN